MKTHGDKKIKWEKCKVCGNRTMGNYGKIKFCYNCNTNGNNRQYKLMDGE